MVAFVQVRRLTIWVVNLQTLLAVDVAVVVKVIRKKIVVAIATVANLAAVTMKKNTAVVAEIAAARKHFIKE